MAMRPRFSAVSLLSLLSAGLMLALPAATQAAPDQGNKAKTAPAPAAISAGGRYLA